MRTNNCPLDRFADLPVDWGMLLSWLRNRREAKARAAHEAELLFRFMSDTAWQEANLRAKDMSLPQAERVRALAARWDIEQRLNEQSQTHDHPPDKPGG